MREPRILEQGVVEPRRSPWLKRLLLGGGLLLIAALGGPYLYYALTTNNDLQDAFAEADRLDPGWQIYEVESRRVQIPDEENSAIPLMAACWSLPSPWPYWDAGKDPENPNRDPQEIANLRKRFEKLQQPAQLDELQIKELRREFKRAAAALAEARKVVDMPRGHHPITYAPDFISTMLPQTQNTRGIGHLLAYDVLVRAQDQDFDGALDSCRAILNAGRSIGDEPTLISMLVRVALDLSAMGKIERVLAQGQPSENALVAVQHLLEKEAEEPLLLIAVRGERGMLDGLMQGLQDGTVPYKQLQGLVSQRPFSDSLEALASMELAVLPGALKRNRAALLKFHNQIVEIAKRPVEEQIAPFKELFGREKDLPWVARAFASPAKAIGAYHRDQASLRCAVVMVAVERYRRAHGRWPVALTDLVPAYLAKVPIDLYDGTPLRFRPFPEGVIIYSVGPDGQDNGGNLSDRPDKEGTDLGFRLWDVAKRRQPPRPWQNDAED